MRAIFIILVVLLASAAIACNMAGEGQTTGRMEREPQQNAISTGDIITTNQTEQQGINRTDDSITGLDPSTSYHFQVRANNNERNAGWS